MKRRLEVHRDGVQSRFLAGALRHGTGFSPVASAGGEKVAIKHARLLSLALWETTDSVQPNHDTTASCAHQSVNGTLDHTFQDAYCMLSLLSPVAAPTSTFTPGPMVLVTVAR